MESVSKLLDKRTALITGGSRGIGFAIAKLFASQGADLVLEKSYGAKVLVYSCNVADLKEVMDVYDQLLKQQINLDILVNNAGVMQDAVIGMVTPQLIEKVFSVNVYGTIYNSQLAVKSMLRNRKGSIINLCSIVGVSGYQGQSIYSASKAAIIGLTKSLSKELAGLNIRVNAIAPGFIETDLVKHLSEGIIAKNLENIRMKRAGTADEVANSALYLASDMSAYVTGQVIGVDGGMLI